MTTVATISDLHGQLPRAPDIQVDVLAIAGDICPDFSRNKFVNVSQQSAWLDRTFRPWLESITAAGTEVVAIWGNHDYLGESAEYQALFDDLPWTLLQDKSITLPQTGLTVWGTPWVPKLPRWAFYGTPETLKRRAAIIPSGLDLLLTHGPPFMVGDLDMVPAPPPNSNRANKYGQYFDEHVGDPTLNDAIRRARPKLTVCGHIHEGHGSSMINDLPVVNVAAVDAQYQLREKPWTVFELTSIQGFSGATRLPPVVQRSGHDGN